MISTQALKSATHLGVGGARYALSGRTPPEAYQSLIRLFCNSGGRVNDGISNAISLLNPVYRLDSAQGLLGDLSGSSLARVQDDLEHRGFHIFEQRIPADICERLMKFALSTPCTVRGRPSTDESALTRQVDRYDPTNPLGVIYDFDVQTLIDNMDVQRLISDGSFLAVAQSYLRCKPLLDVLSMWWATAYSEKADLDAAQFYHFDMDRIKWLKFFVYLTDVGAEQGPHCYVDGSHRAGGIPQSLLDKGYVRLSDEEVASSYPPERVLQFTAPAGTVIAEDTRGLHKGKNIQRGHRLMLQLQFSNSHFGADLQSARVSQVKSEQFARMQRKYPRIYRMYVKR